jgi:hypothetical protein
MQLDADTPSVVPLVTDDTGSPRVDVQVTMDGELVASKLDGVSLSIDPGMHEFSFSSGGNVFATQKILVLQGQRNRPIAVSLPAADSFGVTSSVVPPADVEAKTTILVKRATIEKPAMPEKQIADEPSTVREPPAKQDPEPSLPTSVTLDVPSPPETPKKSARSTVPYWLGGVGLVGLGAYGTFVYWARTDNMMLAQCAPNCPQESVDHIRHLYLAADISFGVGVASLAAATYLFVKGASKKTTPTPSAQAIEVTPTRSGAIATVSGTF